MDEDQILQSIIADPDVVDPTIDVSQLRQTTPTSSRLLGDVSGIEGLRYDPTRTDYIRDLYSVYSGWLPTIDVAQDTAQIPKAIDTLVDAGSTDQVTGGGGTTPTETITPDPVVAPGEIPVTQEEIDLFNEIPVTQPSFDDQFQSIEDIGTPIDIGFGEGQVDPGLAAGLEGPIIDTSPVTPTITAPSGDVFAVDDPLAEEKIDFTPETQGLVDQAFSKVGSTASDIMNDLSQIPGAIADFANQTVDIAGQKINVGATLLRAGINKIVGGPISLVFDALGAVAGMLPDGISATTEKARTIGLIQGDNTVTQDKYGINTQSAFGDYDQYNIDRVEQLEDKINKTPRDIQELKDRQEYNKISGVGGDIDDDPTGDAEIAEIIAQQDRNEIQPTDPSLEIPDRGRGDGDGPSPSGQEGSGGGGFGGYEQGAFADDATGSDTSPGATGGEGGFDDDSFSDANTGFDTSPGATGGEGGYNNGGGKGIVCTMMNDFYGFGSFRNKIWLEHSKSLAPEYQKGYHKIFLPLVAYARKNGVTNKIVRKTLEHIAVHRTIDIRQEARGKMHLLGRIYRKILEPICYIVGKHAKR